MLKNSATTAVQSVVLAVMLSLGFVPAAASNTTTGERPPGLEAVVRIAPDDPRQWHPSSMSADETPFQTTSDVTSCEIIGLYDFDYEIMAAHVDSAARITEFYVGNFRVDRIVRYTVDSDSNVAADTLAIPYGEPWIAEDLDLDGNLDLVLQRGDGTNGFLDIVSLPSGNLRQRFVFPGMNVVMYPQSLELTSDSLPEILVTPRSLGGTTLAAVIGFDAVDNSFKVLSEAYSPYPSFGRAAYGDFDNDGRIEFLQSNMEGVALYEWSGQQLLFRGQVWAEAEYVGVVKECRPKPGGVLCALIGYSASYTSYYILLSPTGDNTFSESEHFEKYVAGTGGIAASALDADCDGLDEITLNFAADCETYEWDESAQTFVLGCGWNGTGSLPIWFDLDINWDGSRDWVFASASGHLWAFDGADCPICDATGICSPPAVECICVCHADPACDGVRCDILDVVETINVAFRSGSEQNDPAPLCASTQTDVDCSGATDIADVVRVIDVALRGASAPTEFCNPCDGTLMVDSHIMAGQLGR